MKKNLSCRMFKMLNQVQHDDKEKGHPEFISGSHPKQFALGRSMTEMLGVLAIVGVLSIVAVLGLKTVFIKYQSNNLIEDVKLAGFTVIDEKFKTMSVDETKQISGNFVPKTDYVFSVFKETDTTFAVLVDGVSEKVCLDLKSKKVEWLEEIKANDLKNLCKVGDTNQMLFYFNSELGGNTEQESTECRTNKDCSAPTSNCCNGVCQTCACGQITKGNECVVCSSTASAFYPVSETECHKCDNMFHKVLDSNGGYCIGCENGGNWTTTLANCARCPNRFWTAGDGSITNNGALAGICAKCPTGQSATTDGLSCR